MHYVIISWLLMTLCLNDVNIIDGKLSFQLNQFVVLKDYVEHMFYKMLRIFGFAMQCFAFLKNFISFKLHFSVSSKTAS